VRRLGVATAILLLTFAAGCGPGPLVRHGQINEDAVGVVRQNLPAIRGLSFTTTVPAVALSPAEVRAAMEADVDASYGPDDLARVEAVYVRLGLFPPDARLRDVLAGLYEEEGAGFYDPRTKRLVVATRPLRAPGRGMRLIAALTGRDFAGEFVVAHELTHALQDQHWGIPTAAEPLTAAHGDRLLARRAFLEGDATLAGFAYLLGGEPDAATLTRITRELDVLPAELATRYPSMPEVIRASVAFEYQTGTAFAAWGLRSGGFPAVDAVHRDPPASSEQVLHPERYYHLRDSPMTVSLGGTEGIEAAGYAPTVEDTLGELHVRVLAGQGLDAAGAARIADGWGGDRFRALARGDDLVLVWLTAWDSPGDAEEFAAALPAFLADARVEQRDDRVLVLLGPAAGGGPDLQALARRVWATSRVTRDAA
jgi:hypothetical protein